jgi:chemotaxis protein CheX
MTVELAPSVGDLTEMVEQVWTSYLDPDGRNPLIPVDGGPAGTEVHSWVSISGPWHGHVVYASSTTAAREAAAAFLAMPADEVSQDDVSDVLGELANIVGGNLKAMLPPGCLLSLPQVVLAPDSATRYPGQAPVCALHGTWGGEPVSIMMWQGNEAGKEEAA